MLIAFAPIAEMLGVARMKSYGMIVTDRRVFLIRLSGKVTWSASVEGTRPRGRVRIVSYEPGKPNGKLTLEWPSDGDVSAERLTLSVKWNYQQDAASVAAALSVVSDST